MGIDYGRLKDSNEFIELPPGNKIELGRKVDVMDGNPLGFTSPGKFSSLSNNHADAEA
jgi:hypothetical protein